MNQINSDILNRIDKLSPYEAQGYQSDFLSKLKQSMIDYPDKAKVAFEIYDFCLTTDFWPDDLKKHFKQYPLSSLSQFFYNNYSGVEDWVNDQILAIEESINSTKRYILTLKRSYKTGVKFWERTNDERINSINVIKSDYEKYVQNLSI